MNNEISKGIDRAHIKAGSGVGDFFNWGVVWTCEKWSEDAVDYARRKLGIVGDVSSAALRKLIVPGSPDYDLFFQQEEVLGNSLTNAGIARLMDVALIGTGQAWNSTHAGVGTGDDNTAFSASQTDLIAAAGSTHRQFEPMNSTYPSRSAQTVTFQADFGTSVGNYHWQEWGIDQNAASAATTVTTPLLNRKVEDLGTKTTGTWTLSGAITIA
jgi:hypothetical protein